MEQIKRTDEQKIFDVQWNQYLELERLIKENVIKSELDFSVGYKEIIEDLCHLAININLSLEDKASILFDKDTLKTIEKVCEQKRDEINEISKKIETSRRK